MLEVKLLGTGGMMPLNERYLTSMLLKFNGVSFLVDCGEGTQLALRNAGESSKDIDLICITHFHADHISGLPGMLLLMGNQGKISPLTIIGPKGLTNVVKHLRIIAPVLPFEVNCIELDANSNSFKLNELTIHTFNELTVTAFKVKHKVECYGYTFDLGRLQKFEVEKARKLPIDKKYWGKLQHGETVIVDGVTYTPDMVLGEERKGLKVTYCTDTRPCANILNFAKDSDLFICEAMYGDLDKKTDALDKKHMMMTEAAEGALRANVKELWVTHFSPSMVRPVDYLSTVKQIFKNTIIPKDGQYKLLTFED